MSPPATILADEAIPGPLTIRSYNLVSASSRELGTTRQVAWAVFNRAGVEARWRECRTAIRRADADPCTDVIAPGEVVVRIVTAPGGGASQSLGDSYVDPTGGGGVLATVFADRVHAAAARTGGDAPVLLGRAIAHEVGHLLIGTPRHSTRGLMRASWTDQELRREREVDWLFSDRQAGRIRQTLRARQGTQLGPVRTGSAK
jgi:hypothetical protein